MGACVRSSYGSREAAVVVDSGRRCCSRYRDSEQIGELKVVATTATIAAVVVVAGCFCVGCTRPTQDYYSCYCL